MWLHASQVVLADSPTVTQSIAATGAQAVDPVIAKVAVTVAVTAATVGNDSILRRCFNVTGPTVRGAVTSATTWRGDDGSAVPSFKCVRAGTDLAVVPTSLGWLKATRHGSAVSTTQLRHCYGLGSSMA